MAITVKSAFLGTSFQEKAHKNEEKISKGINSQKWLSFFQKINVLNVIYHITLYLNGQIKLTPMSGMHFQKIISKFKKIGAGDGG